MWPTLDKKIVWACLLNIDLFKGIIEIIWEYTDTMVDDNNWIEGEVEVRAHYVDDIPQNYTVSITFYFIK